MEWRNYSMMLDVRAWGSSEARCVVGCLGQQVARQEMPAVTRLGEGMGPHLKLHVCLGKLFCFLFQ